MYFPTCHLSCNPLIQPLKSPSLAHSPWGCSLFRPQVCFQWPEAPNPPSGCHPLPCPLSVLSPYKSSVPGPRSQGWITWGSWLRLLLELGSGKGSIPRGSVSELIGTDLEGALVGLRFRKRNKVPSGTMSPAPQHANARLGNSTGLVSASVPAQGGGDGIPGGVLIFTGQTAWHSR